MVFNIPTKLILELIESYALNHISLKQQKRLYDEHILLTVWTKSVLMMANIINDFFYYGGGQKEI